MKFKRNLYSTMSVQGKLLSAFVAVCLISPVAIADTDRKIKFERAKEGIAAPLVDLDDYYYSPNGKKIKFYRKKDVYAVQTKRSAAKLNNVKQSMMTRIESRFAGRVKAEKRHRLGAMTVLRVDNSQKSKREAQQSFDIDAQLMQGSDSRIDSVMPVFSGADGNGDLLMMSLLTMELTDTNDPAQELARLAKKYGLRLVRKLRLSGDVYSVALNNRRLAPSKRFSLVRRLMNEQSVAWAEPQFYFKPTKSQFVPNDALFGQQWHLRDRGFRGSRCDTDCDADNAWALTSGTGVATGAGTVIAIVDDGVEIDHPDLRIFSNNDNTVPNNNGELGGVAGVDDDGNGFVDDFNGYDFVTDFGGTLCENGQSTSDGQGTQATNGQDNDPNPRDPADCTLLGDVEPLAEDNHGTAVAGIAAAIGNNNIGVAGVAFSASVLPVRLISDFDEEPLLGNDESFCDVAAEAMEYAAQDADVINNSWSIPIECMVLEEALARVTNGDVTMGRGSKRPNGSPVIFASGNNASGWIKVTVPVSAGEHAYEWRHLRSDDPDLFSAPSIVDTDDVVRLDDIVFPNGDFEGFETGFSSEFTNEWELNSCNAVCTSSFGSEPVWQIQSQAPFVRSGLQSAELNAGDSDCGNSYLHIIKDGPADDISFWVWVSANTESGSDRFEFLVDGQEVLSYGDLPAFGFINNDVAYPASLSATIPGVIAVGASGNGDLSGDATDSLSAEERIAYSQYGPELDVVAPSSNQHTAITSTDRTGVDGFSAGDFTSDFTGTSASAAIVSGVAAAMIAIDNTLSANDIRQMIRDSADQIGTLPYVSGRNDFHGHGRVNMFKALQLAAGQTITDPSPACAPDSFDYNPPLNDLLLSRFAPQATEFCPAQGPLPESDEACFVIKAANGNVITFCL